MTPPTDQPLFMISVAAGLAGMHPQTLRMYERRGLVAPNRSAGNTRLYSQGDIDVLRRIQQLSETGLNLTGIERVLELERQLRRAERRIASLRRELVDAQLMMRQELARERRSLRAELVLVSRQTALVPSYRPVIAPRRTEGGR